MYLLGLTAEVLMLAAVLCRSCIRLTCIYGSFGSHLCDSRSFFYDTTHIFLRCVENYTHTFARSIFLRYYPHFVTMCGAFV